MPESNPRWLGVLRAAALVAMVIGAAGSMGLMVHAGSRQRSLLLVSLFTFWVLSPFVPLWRAGMVSNRWPPFHRAALYASMLILALSSLAMYAGIFPMPKGSRPAAVFLVTPAASWVFIAVATLVSGQPWWRSPGKP